MLDDEMQHRLSDAIASYDRRSGGRYDEVFHEVGCRARSEGEMGKAGVAALGFWKRTMRGPWMGGFLDTSEGEVRAATRLAFTAADRTDDREALRALAMLPGFANRGAMATTVLACYQPDGYAVMDRRALAGLAALGRPVEGGSGVTRRYLTEVRGLRSDLADAGGVVPGRGQGPVRHRRAAAVRA